MSGLGRLERPTLCEFIGIHGTTLLTQEVLEASEPLPVTFAVALRPGTLGLVGARWYNDEASGKNLAVRGVAGD